MWWLCVLQFEYKGREDEMAWIDRAILHKSGYFVPAHMYTCCFNVRGYENFTYSYVLVDVLPYM